MNAAYCNDSALAVRLIELFSTNFIFLQSLSQPDIYSSIKSRRSLRRPRRFFDDEGSQHESHDAEDHSDHDDDDDDDDDDDEDDDGDKNDANDDSTTSHSLLTARQLK